MLNEYKESRRQSKLETLICIFLHSFNSYFLVSRATEIPANPNVG